MLNVIKASAGSGKTFTLALEYISLLLGYRSDDGSLQLYRDGRRREYHRHILAVTFTNKATEEMKQRIVHELAVLAGMRDEGKSQYLGELCQRFGATKPDVRKAARRALTELLHDYANFGVSTIDSFFQMILRTFAAEVDIPYDYDIELNDDYALQVGIHDFLSKISSDRKKHSQVLGWLKKYVHAQLLSGGNWNPFKSGNHASAVASDNLFSLASVINKEIFRNLHDDMEKYLKANNGGNIGRFQTYVEEQVKCAEEAIEKVFDAANATIEGSGYAEFRKGRGCMSSWLAKAENRSPGSKELESLRSLHAKNDNILKKLPKGMPEPSPDLQESVRQCCTTILDIGDRLLLFRSIAKNIYQLGLLGHISQSVFDFRKENNIILLSDTNELLHDIINKDETPFIYERIGTWVNNFLIDEFQDTSAMQWQNMMPLLSHSLASGNDDLIIGDEKQCIYRFRNSDPSLLQSKVHDTFKKWIADSDDKSRNWRSTPNVIKFNNTLFSVFAKEAGLTDVYANVVQLTNEKKRRLSGHVRVNMVRGDDATPLNDRVIDLVCDMLDRGYRQSDIAILVDRNVEGSEIIRAILDHNKTDEPLHELNVVSSDSLLLNNSPAIRLIVSHLRYIGLSMAMMGDDGKINNLKAFNERLHRLLRQYERHINAGDRPEEALRQCFEHPDKMEASMDDTRSFLKNDSESFSLVSIVERIIEKTLSNDARSDENPFIQAFQDLVIDYSSRYNATIMSFLRWWDRIGCRMSITSPAGIDAINVMTIHKSKGLEFPCVIIPYANWSIGKTDPTLWFTRSEMEKAGILANLCGELIPPLTPVSGYSGLGKSALATPYSKYLKESITDCMNKTYVAFTRAVDELHIFTDEFKGGDSESLSEAPHTLSHYFSHFFNEMGQGEVADSINRDYAAATGQESADVATGIEKRGEPGNEYYCVGEPAQNDRKASAAEETMLLMPDYKVENRHDLAKYQLPQVFMSTRQEEGVTLHKVLSMIRSADDVERTLLYCKAHFVVAPDKYGHVSELLRSIICQSDEVRRWFARGNRVYNERTILVGDERYRPDRVVVTPEGDTIVIDYKFGLVHSKAYTTQVRRYVDFLRQSGMKNVSGRIWYPLEKKIHTV